MFKNIKLLCVGLLFPFASYADEVFTPLSVAIVSSDNSEIQISTTKDTLHGDDVLICPAAKNSCRAYHGSDFSIAKPNYSVEDVAAEKIYIHTPLLTLKTTSCRHKQHWLLFFTQIASEPVMLNSMTSVGL